MQSQITRVALDDRYANKFAHLDSTTIYPKPSHQLLYTPMTGEMKCPMVIPLPCAFHSISSKCRCNTCTDMINNNMIHSISSHDCIGPSILTPLALHRCLSPSAPSYHNLPFTLATGPLNQVLTRSSPPWSHDSMSFLICDKLLHNTITCGLIPCVSHIRHN
jgi:hypothetical protein